MSLIELAVKQRIAELHREAEAQRLAQRALAARRHRDMRFARRDLRRRSAGLLRHAWVRLTSRIARTTLMVSGGEGDRT